MSSCSQFHRRGQFFQYMKMKQLLRFLKCDYTLQMKSITTLKLQAYHVLKTCQRKIFTRMNYIKALFIFHMETCI